MFILTQDGSIIKFGDNMVAKIQEAGLSTRGVTISLGAVDSDRHHTLAIVPSRAEADFIMKAIWDSISHNERFFSIPTILEVSRTISEYHNSGNYAEGLQ